MGYGRTPKTVERTKPLLDEMVKSDKSIEWIFDDPSNVAYKIWEAIHYAVRSKKKEFEPYTTLLNKFKIKVVEPDIVKAELKKETTLNPNRVIIREVTDVLEVIAYVIENKKKLMIFPDIEVDRLEDADKAILTAWCRSNSYLYNSDVNRLVLTRKEDE